MHRLFRHKKLILVAFVFLIAASLYVAKDLSFVHVHEDYIPRDDTEYAFLKKFNRETEIDDLGLFIALEHSSSIFDTAFLKRLDQFTKACHDLPHIDRVSSLTNFEDQVIGPFGSFPLPAIHLNSPKKLINDSARIAKDPRLAGNLVSHDYQSACIVIKTEPELTQEQSEELYDSMHLLIEEHGFNDFHESGRVCMQTLFVRQAEFEIRFYVLLFSILIFLVLLILYRSFWSILVPLFSVFGGLLFFFGFIAISGQQLNVMSTLFPTLMLIFGMADITHLQTKYIDMMERGFDRLEAMKVVIKEVGLALFLTSATTAIGFISLATSKVNAIRMFGVNSAIGVMIAYLTVIIFATAGLMFFNKGQLSRAKNQYASWKSFLTKISEWNRKYPKAIYVGVIVILIISGFGISTISTNAYLMGDFPKKGSLRSDYIFFEQNFNGTRSFEIAILPAKGKKVTDNDVLRELNTFQTYLMNEHQLTNILSPLTYYKSLNKSYNGASQEAYIFPDTDRKIKKYTSILSKNRILERENLVNEELSVGRITGSMKDPGSNVVAQQNSVIRNWLQSNINTDVVKFKFTGISLMVDKNNEYMINSISQGLFFAFLIVGLIFAAIFKDYKLILISLVPNIIPLFIAGAAMGLLGIELKATTSVIFAISFGIAVDDTIHFLTRFNLERRKGLPLEVALKNTFLTSGKAIILTTLILVAGFASLMWSDFTGTYYIGILVCITLTSALIADLFVAPQLIYMVYGLSRKELVDSEDEKGG